MTIAVGCTGGKHRSVAMAEALAARLGRDSRRRPRRAPRPGARMSGATSARSARPVVVALGGGHGLYATLRAARRLSTDVTAVVTVADDGGSSGRLRARTRRDPAGRPADGAGRARRATNPTCRTWTDDVPAPLRRHRRAGRSLGRQPDPRRPHRGAGRHRSRRWTSMARCCGVQGRVLPMSPIPLDIVADVERTRRRTRRVRRCIRGQVAVATTPGKVRRVRLLPADPPACPEALAAIEQADLVPRARSWFSSVIPHLLVPDLPQASDAVRGAQVVILNLAAEPGETDGILRRSSICTYCCQHAPRTHGRRRDRRLGVGAGRAADATSVAAPRRRLGAGVDLRGRRRGTAPARITRASSRRVLDADRARRSALPVEVPEPAVPIGQPGRETHHVAMTADGQGRAQPAGGDQGLGRKAEVSALLRFAGRAAHRGRPGRRRGGAGHRHRSRGGCAGRSSSCTATRADVHVLGAGGLRKSYPLHRAGGRRTARRWPARPGCSTCAAVRCAGCRRRSSAAASATRRRPGAARSWRTAR